MLAVRINGEESELDGGGLPKIADLIELIKAAIDPSHMITSILIDGQDMSDSDWMASPAQYGTSIIEIETGTPAQFVATRFGAAGEVVKACYLEFREARKSFQAGQMQEANKRLSRAVNTLQAFFEWYTSLLELVPEEERNRYDINPEVEEISEVCKQICQQQLYQSWWALGESIKNSLEPKLDDLEDVCRKFQVESAEA